MSNLKEADLSAENTFTDPLDTGQGDLPVFIFVSGTWEGVISVQVTVNGSWETMPNFRHTDNFASRAPTLPINSQVRVGFLTGDYGSGTATIKVTQ